ncbi:uncharacterized protein [Halyomorpha halys]|uniref:uncharacterized protein isoform X5 n=1 Tax=Halyomorpha halys TaxID=286706 RepID=UPI0006D512E3|nr:uncharacterized protein LOC106683215 isoform X5 [Halyomorpha halys]
MARPASGENAISPELNSMIHKMMDATTKRKYSMSFSSRFSKNRRDPSIIRRRNSLKSKKTCYNFNSSNSENRDSDFKMKPCFVKLDKICDIELSKLLPQVVYSKKVQSNSREFKIPCLQPIEMIHNSTKNLGQDRIINVNADSNFLATEDNLDLLMGRAFESAPQKGKRFNGRDESESSRSIKDSNLNPVVLLKRLSPQFISRAIIGKLEMESHEFTQKRKRKFSSLQRMGVTKGLRRSERLINISLSTEGQNSYFYNGRKSCPTRRQYKIEGDKETIFGNKENVSRPRKRFNEAIASSDDEEEFYGFENQSKNVIMIRHRINKLKNALKTLNGQPPGKERSKLLKLKGTTKTFHPCPFGKENGRTTILNRNIKNLMRHKVPFKAVNSTKEDIFQNPTIEDYQSSLGSNHLNVKNKMTMVRRNNVQSNDAGNAVVALNRLEILKLFKEREKLLISKMVRDQGKKIVSKTGELWNEDTLSDEPLNYYSDKYYIKRIGRRKPLWAERSITNVIMEFQEQIPSDIIVGYFQDHDHTDPTSIAEFLGNAFLDDIAVEARWPC